MSASPLEAILESVRLNERRNDSAQQRFGNEPAVRGRSAQSAALEPSNATPADRLRRVAPEACSMAADGASAP